MNVPSLEFLAFVAAVAVVLAPSRAAPWRRGVFFAANLAFVLTFSHDPRALAPFAGLLTLGFVAMRLLERYKNRVLFAVAIVALVLVFCWLKRYAFVPREALLTGTYLTIGMSYVFFRIASLVIDAFQGALPARVGPVSYVDYTLCFPSFVSGPIQPYRQYRRDESERPARLDVAVAGAALERIAVGFFKVTIASPLLGYAHARSIEMATAAASFDARTLAGSLILAVFPLYLYANFSGYTDVVIGAARFLRLELPENFHRPFTATGYLEFWSRWHMSLSNWFKTYVYTPFLLVSMRRFPDRKAEPLLAVAAYFVTFFLVGLWHGQSVMFVWLGLLMGLGASGNKLFTTAMSAWLGRARYRAGCSNVLVAALSRGLTYTWLAVTLVFFWAPQEQFVRIVGALGWAAIAGSACLTLAVAALGLWLWKGAGDGLAALDEARPPGWAAVVKPACYAALVTATISVAVVLEAPAPHIIYRGF